LAVDFVRDVRGLLQVCCVECHGAEINRADLRLDAGPYVLRGGESGEVLVAGSRAESVLFQRVSSEDPELRMPPKGAGLTAEQVEALGKWIDSGARWVENDVDRAALRDPRLDHWAYQPIAEVRPPLPGDAVDAFVKAKLADAGLELSAAADRRTLLRRVHLVVTGLAPGLEEVEVFERDASADAYARRVDALLDSPHYGEKWARHWLDVVRFADSAGFETNHERPSAWRYRDYVIGAFNDDKPYDRFMFEQIAGDAVGEDVATGFLVAGPWDRVKGKDQNLQLMQRADELSDMVNATGTTFLASTLGCAKCHSHKFDPITQTDFYAIQAVLSGVQHGEREVRGADWEKKQEELRRLEAELVPLQGRLAAVQARAVTGRRLVIDDEPPDVAVDGPGVRELKVPRSMKPVLYDEGRERGQAGDVGDARRLPNFAVGYRHFSEPSGTDCFAWLPKVEGRFRIWLSWGVWPSHAPDARYVLDLDGDPETRADQREIAVINQRQFADGAAAVPQARRWSGLKSAGWHELREESAIFLRMGDQVAPLVADLMLLEEFTGEEGEDAVTPHVRVPVVGGVNTEVFDPVEARWVRFVIEEAEGAEVCVDELEVFTAGDEPRNVALASAGARARSGGDYGDGKSVKHRLEHIHDGRYGNDFSWIAKQKAGGWVELELAAVERIDRVLWSRDRSSGGRVYTDRLPKGYRVEVSVDGESWQTVAGGQDRLPGRYRDGVKTIPVGMAVPAAQLEEVEVLRVRAAELAGQMEVLRAAPMAYAGKFEQPLPTRRLHRGDHLTPREVVAPDALSVFVERLGSLGLDVDAPEQERRVAFGKWLVDARNPLPARVMVNRLWHSVFGAGIVGTPSDFGLMGFRPTHPELLDWLAGEFIRSGWSVKHVLRLLLLSETFQQGSAPVERGLAVDAGNTLLWRFAPRRLDAELIRDNLLAVCGTLDLTMGGPGFLLFEPNANYSRNWVAQVEGFEREDFRRMIYALKLRMEQDAVFGAFDIPDSGQVCASRARSTTPLQALNLFNSGFVLEQAEALERRVVQVAGTVREDQVRVLFELVYARRAEAEEVAAGVAFAVEHGLAALCRALLNSNEFLFVE
jgi:hypothetical protein